MWRRVVKNVTQRWSEQNARRMALARENRAVNLQPVPTRADQAALDEQLQRLGVRPFPYPFASALTITSDTDCTTRDRYNTYTECIVNVHGLDFGDSCWLTAQASDRTPEVERGGFGFFSPDFRIDPQFAHQESPALKDTYELIREHHRGNIDHLHAFTPRGPRVIILEDIRPTGDDGFLALPPADIEETDWYHRANGFPILAVGVWFPADAKTIINNVTASDLGGREYAFVPADEQTGFGGKASHFPEGVVFFLKREFAIRDDIGTLDYADLKHIRIVTGAGGTNLPPLRVMVFNQYRKLLLERLRFLREELHFRTNLLTMHGVWHFYTAFRLENENKRNDAKLSTAPIGTISNYGAFDVPGLRFSTVADDPASFACVAPELFREFGITFIRLTQGRRYAAHSLRGERARARHCEASELVYPISTRGGDVIFNLCAAFPPLVDAPSEVSAREAGRTRARTFSARLAVILDDLEETPGQYAAFYTHLGHWGDEQQAEVPRFDTPTVRRLKARYFGLSDGGGGDRRIWFTRASVAANYARLLQALPGLVRGRGANHIQLGKNRTLAACGWVPQHGSELFGLTFYVRDVSRARVFLEGTEIADLVRNAADGSGRASVSVAECGIRHVVFDEANPKNVRQRGQAGGGWQEDGVVWSWHERTTCAARGRAFGRMDLAEKRGLKEPGRVSMSLAQVDPGGSQFFMYSVRRSNRDVLVGCLLETVAGGKYFFGDKELSYALESVIGSYFPPRTSKEGRAWERVVVPFYDLAWTSPGGAGEILPSHRPARVDLLVAGQAGDWVALDAVEYGRARIGRPRDARHPHVLGGRVVPACKGIRIACRGLGDRAEMRAVTDPLGGFWFQPLRSGAYEICITDEGDPDWTRAQVIEVACDRFDVELYRQAAVAG